MKRILIIPALFTLFIFPTNSSTASESHQSPYAGQEKRAIKSLSKKDIEELVRGGGWGLAKAAELNGMPEPAHILEMKSKIGLSTEQEIEIKNLYEKMNQNAVKYGQQLVKLEKRLNEGFANRTINRETLSDQLNEIAAVRKQLRFIHLSTHLVTPSILSPHQIAQYNKLRGYSADDPCKNIPEGHDEKKWRMHNNCN